MNDVNLNGIIAHKSPRCDGCNSLRVVCRFPTPNERAYLLIPVSTGFVGVFAAFCLPSFGCFVASTPLG